MATEVLLMANVDGLGAEGDVVQVADGYARNYLLPRKLGAPVTKAARGRLEKIRAEREAARQAEVQTAQELANRLQSVSCTIAVKTGEDERLYGSVTSTEIAAVLAEQGVEIDRHTLMLEAPIKELGVFDVTVKLHAEVETSLKVWVVEE